MRWIEGLIVVFGFLVATGACGDTTNTSTVVRSGYLPQDVMQHPVDPDVLVGEWTQGYLDVVEEGRPAGQIVLLFPKQVRQPDQTGRLIRVTGILERINLGGTPGTKSSYANELIRVQSWTYEAETNTTRHAQESTGEEHEPHPQR